MADFYRGLETRAAARLFALEESFQQAGVGVRHEILFGKRAETIVRYAEDQASGPDDPLLPQGGPRPPRPRPRDHQLPHRDRGAVPGAAGEVGLTRRFRREGSPEASGPW